MRSSLIAAAILGCVGFQPVFAAELCIVPSSNGVNQTLDCDGIWRRNETVGFGTEGEPCGNHSSPACWGLGTGYFQWTISASAGDPYVNVAEAPDTLHLWCSCGVDEEGDDAGLDLSFAEFGVSGDLEVLEFTPGPGVLNSGTHDDLQLAIAGCRSGWVYVGALSVNIPTPVSQSGWGRIKSTYR
jgi:hypothetical protein